MFAGPFSILGIGHLVMNNLANRAMLLEILAIAPLPSNRFGCFRFVFGLRNMP